MHSQILSTFLAVLLTALAIMTSAHPTPEDAPNFATELEDPTREVKAFSDGPLITLDGTVEKVHAKPLTINPDYDNWKKSSPVPDPQLERREQKWRDIDEWDVHCKQFGDRAHTYNIRQGIDFIRRLDGNPHLRNRHCKRISCSYKSAVTWCNDNYVGKTLPSWDNVADAVQVMVDNCDQWNNLGGWKGHQDGWRVIIHKDDC